MTFALLLIIPLVCLVVVLPIKAASHPSERLQQLLAEPLRAASVLAFVNLCILSLTAALFLGLNVLRISGGPLLAMVGGPVLSLAAWTHMGKAMPLVGTRRWSAVVAGMSPYLLLVMVALLWTQSIPESGSEHDPFMAFLGGLMLMAAGIGGATVGTLVTLLVRDRS